MVSEPPNWFFSLCAFSGFVLVTIPLPWHLEAWNTGTCLYMIWTGLACLNQFINSVVWNSNVINSAPVWCDISTKFIIGSAVAIPASSLCINRRLYQIASVSSVTKTKAQKRRDVMVDLSIGLGIPIIQMCVHYVVQGHRFNIFEEVGCYPFTWNTPQLMRSSSPGRSPSVRFRTIRELAIRRAQFKELLSANKNLSSSRYFRLMGLAGIEVVSTIPLGAYSIYLNATAQPIQRWISWSNTHYDFSAVGQYPSVVWHENSLTVMSIQLTRYFVVICAVIFFAFFGLAEEARKNYRQAYQSVAKRVGLSTGAISATGTWTANGTNPDMSYGSRPGNMPVFITQRTERKRDSLASFSTDLSLGDYGGALDDVKKEEPYSPTSSGGSISKETLPISPVDSNDLILPTLPEPTLDINAVPRHVPDAPTSVDVV
ncbi:pheromone A receptor-domain-containing protein [Melanogaster broomeanus]|nr:pheromone A receptor-domain-containing protein [Melanogaster broomeanus]